MKEIKFRAWLKKQKLMRYNVSIHAGQIFTGHCWIPFDNNVELMQYTNLKDNNYDEIYEGDIVEILTEVEEYGIVKFLDGAFYVEADGFRVNFYDNIRGGDVLVIGNIYENKELLG